MSSELVVDLPRHGDLKAFIPQGKLAKLIRRGSVSIILVDLNWLFGPAVHSVL